MTVEVTPLNVLGSGTPPVTRFTDNFNRASGPLGQNWAEGVIPLTPVIAPIAMSTFQINQAPDLTQACAVVAQGSNLPNTLFPAYAVALPLVTSIIWGKTQFQQFVFKDNTMTGNDAFLPVLCFKPSENFAGYVLQIALGVPQVKLQRWQPNAANQPGTSLGTLTNLVSNINGNAVPGGTVILMSADFSVPAQVTLTVKFNGGVVASFVDNTPLSGGVPALASQWQHGAGSAQTVHIGSYVAGLGLS